MRPGSAFRRAPSPAGAEFGRKLWFALASDVRAAAAAVCAGEALEDHRVTVLRGLLKRARHAGFPVEGLSAEFARQALVAAWDGFLVAAPERRSAFAVLLLAALDLIERLLAEAGQAMADRTWKRHMGEG